ncbi:MAG: hypothetical protein E5X33_12075 [Mesorhizobium sp.]|uniref:hypothetical protein n=1 Tax=unclassified Mesorhizobium TaxID=325217 RepID=UPI00121A6C99|nr:MULTISPECIES: hypothetical protein [unclassified Mesorhizobium]MDG4908130.1 hypothetical protein [Mesorhizobium sp. WSM4898]TIR21795.1 MAG: hypothetical protein E5X33_12075 [Mesorhizobium sp.]
MTIPSIFADHWHRALDAKDIDAISFRDEADAIAFFAATSNRGCFLSLSDQHKESVIALRNRYPDESLRATLDLHAKDRKTGTSPRFIGSCSTGNKSPTVQQLQAEAAAISELVDTMPQAKPRSYWDKAIAKTNARLGL